jgi:hypothetical protein
VVPIEGKAHQLAIGLYEPGSMDRLAARQSEGTPWADGRVLIDIMPGE